VWLGGSSSRAMRRTLAIEQRIVVRGRGNSKGIVHRHRGVMLTCDNVPKPCGMWPTPRCGGYRACRPSTTNGWYGKLVKTHLACKLRTTHPETTHFGGSRRAESMQECERSWWIRSWRSMMAVATDGVTYKLKSEGANWVGKPRLHCLPSTCP
jgi:hypothetical protein